MMTTMAPHSAHAWLCEATAVFPGIRTQSWNVALSDQGPVLVEVNYGGDLNLGQLAHGKGALDDAYADHLRRCGGRPVILRFGQYALNMSDLPPPLDPQPLPFEIA